MTTAWGPVSWGGRNLTGSQSSDAEFIQIGTNCKDNCLAKQHNAAVSCAQCLGWLRGSNGQKRQYGRTIIRHGKDAACLLCRGEGGAEVAVVGGGEEHEPVLQQRAALRHALRCGGRADLVHEQQQDRVCVYRSIHLRRQPRHVQAQRQDAQPPLQHVPAQPAETAVIEER